MAQRFDLSIAIINDELRSELRDMVLAGMLRMAAERVQEGATEGAIRDGNGNTVGAFQLVGDPDSDQGDGSE